MNTLAIGALALASLVQATDTIIPGDGVRRLQLENAGGQVIVRAWDRSEIRIRADHSSRTFIEIRRRGEVLDVEAEADRGPATLVDYEIDIPRNLDLDIEGMYTDVTLEGVGGAISVETLEGNIRIVGGRGRVSAESVNGEIVVRGASGRIEAGSVSRDITIEDSSGEILAESVSGRITLRGIEATLVEAGSVSGTILYDGSVAEDGRYVFGSHSGRIQLILPDGIDATLSATSLTGSVRSDYAGLPSEFPKRRRQSFTIGSGSAQIELETFSGGITIQRRGN